MKIFAISAALIFAQISNARPYPSGMVQGDITADSVSEPYLPMDVLYVIYTYIQDPKQARAFQNLYRNQYFPTNETNTLVEGIQKSRLGKAFKDARDSGFLDVRGTVDTKALLKLQGVYNPVRRGLFAFETLHGLEKIDSDTIAGLKWESVKRIEKTIPSASLNAVPWRRLVSLEEVHFEGNKKASRRVDFMSTEALANITPLKNFRFSGNNYPTNVEFLKDALETIQATSIEVEPCLQPGKKLAPMTLGRNRNLRALKVSVCVDTDLLSVLLDSVPHNQLEELKISFFGPSPFTLAVLSKLSSLTLFECEWWGKFFDIDQVLSHMPLLQTLKYVVDRETPDDQYVPINLGSLEKLKSVTVIFRVRMDHLSKLGRTLATLPKLDSVAILPDLANGNEFENLITALPQFQGVKEFHLTRVKPFETPKN